MTPASLQVAADLDGFFSREDRRIRGELDEFLRIPSISARSEHNADTKRCAEWLASQGFEAVSVAGGVDAWAAEVEPGMARY